MKLIVKRLIKEGKLNEAIRLYTEMVELTRKEEGCLAYGLYQDTENKNTIAIIEEWESNDALDKHKAAPHFIRLVPSINDLTEKKDVEIFNKLI